MAAWYLTLTNLLEKIYFWSKWQLTDVDVAGSNKPFTGTQNQIKANVPKLKVIFIYLGWHIIKHLILPLKLNWTYIKGYSVTGFSLSYSDSIQINYSSFNIQGWKWSNCLRNSASRWGKVEVIALLLCIWRRQETLQSSAVAFDSIFPDC